MDGTQESLEQIRTELRSIESEVENVSKEVHLVRTESCAALAHARDARSVADVQETQLHAISMRVQHVQDHTTEAFRRAAIDTDTRHKRVTMDVAGVQEALSNLRKDVSELQRGMQKLPAERKSANDGAEALMDCLHKRIEQQEHMVKQQWGHIQQSEEQIADLKHTLSELHSHVEQVVCHRSIDKLGKEATAISETSKNTPIPKAAKEMPSDSDTLPLAWRTLLENVVNQVQNMCEETRQEVLEHKKDQLNGMEMRCKAIQTEQGQKIAKVCDQIGEALQHADEALGAARYSAQRTKQIEDTSMRQIANFEAVVLVQAELKDFMLSQQTLCDSLKKTYAEVERSFNDITPRVDHLDQTMRELENTISEVSENVHSNAAELDVQKTQCGEMSTNIHFLQKSMDRAMAEADVLKQQAADEARAAVADKCSELGCLIEKLRSAALEEARKALNEKCGELCDFNEKLREVALEEARTAVTEKCGELRCFAEKLRDAALEEIRNALKGWTPDNEKHPCTPAAAALSAH